MATLLLWIAVPIVGASPDFERCMALDRDFDTTRLMAPCSAAADDATLPVADRLRALRAVGGAHVVNQAPELAERAFLRMLVLSSAAALPPDAGAREVAAFSRAQELFAQQGVVTRQRMDAVRDGGALNVVLELKDPLGRVVRAELVVDAGAPVAMARRDLGLGVVAFDARVPATEGAATASVALIGWDDAQVPVDPAAQVALTAPAPPAPTVSAEEPGAARALPWVLLSAGGVGCLAGSILLGAMELTLADPDLEGAERPGRQLAGRVGLGLAGVSVAVAGAGAALLAVGE